MRPSVRQTGKVLGAALAAAGGYVVIQLLAAWRRRGSVGGQMMLVVILTATLALGLVGYALFFLRARIEVDNERILKVSLWGRRRSFPLAAVGGIALRNIWSPMSRTGNPQVGVLYGLDGRGLFMLSPRFWRPQDVNRLAALLGGVAEADPPTVSRSQLEREFPGALNVWERHPTLVVLPLIALLAGLAAVLLALQG